MSLFSGLDNVKQKMMDSINENPNFQQIKAKFFALNAKSQQMITIAAIAATILPFIILLISLIIKNESTKNQMALMEKQIKYLNESADNLRDLKQRIQNQSVSGKNFVNPSESLKEIIRKTTGRAAIRKESFQVKSLDEDKDQKIDFSLVRISLPQLVQFLFNLEKSLDFLEVNSLSVDTRTDKQGYLWSELSVQRVAKPKTKPKATKKRSSGKARKKGTK